MKNLLGDQSAASDDSHSNIFHRLNIAIYGVPFVPKISNVRIWKYIHTTFFVFENGTFFVFGNGTFSYLKKRHFLYLKVIHFRIWNERLFVFEKDTFFVFENHTFFFLENAGFSYLKGTLFCICNWHIFRIWNCHIFCILKTPHFVFAIDIFFVFESSTFCISKLHISFLIITRLLDKVVWEMPTLQMLTLFRMGIFGAARGWRKEPKKGSPYLKFVTHIPQWWNLTQLYLT